ncbi:hypothetical protein GGTG_05757 [Gaeumannomyces tritici R3-111a-1]|uniref:Uncharacterized protein n=1 Tax=Gaeumannomyces tritici (strain R3-111a-1) TaxID=644352 RepID=J3NWU6_GAET3|nr:hypothetical protein GGTG_05757 [Gaeumannomyces tritici R3-111a-1]EJT75828.1 hypothetical protein GGTG_05757 [Gaeumannomyces tritici R3-111a-1]
MAIWKRKITVSDDTVTGAVHLTVKQSLVPNLLGRMAPDYTMVPNMSGAG